MARNDHSKSAIGLISCCWNGRW